MTAYLVRRLLQAVLVLFGVSLIVFALVQLSGDPVLLMLSGTAATEQDLQELREELGYNDPVMVQYLRYLGDLLSGDMGNSLRFKRPALELVLERLGATALLAVSALIFALVVAIPVGILSAVKRNSWLDHVGMLLALLGQSLPLFWLGIMLVLIFAVRLRWFPVSGIGSWQHLILPMITLGAYPMARIARLLRSSMLDVINADYILTARAKGLTSFTVVIGHALRNAGLACCHHSWFGCLAP